MRTPKIEKKKIRHKSKTNHDEKKKHKSKGTGQNDKETKNEDAKKEAAKKPRNVSVDVRKVFISAIDPYDAPLKWWETEHVRYAINYPPVKFRLERVMGSHVVRLTDRKYMLLLMAKLYENYVEEQKIRIEKRKLSPPSMMSRLLEVSYKALSEKINSPRYQRLRLYV